VVALGLVWGGWSKRESSAAKCCSVGLFVTLTLTMRHTLNHSLLLPFSSPHTHKPTSPPAQPLLSGLFSFATEDRTQCLETGAVRALCVCVCVCVVCCTALKLLAFYLSVL